MNKRTDILKKANEAICGDREQDYGNPESNFRLIANLWSAYIGTDISAVDVAMMMVMLKAARIKSGRLHEDNFIDGAGYFACAGEIASRKAEDPYPVRIECGVPESDEPGAEVQNHARPNKVPYNKKLIEKAKERLVNHKGVVMEPELFKALCGKLYEEACDEL